MDEMSFAACHLIATCSIMHKRASRRVRRSQQGVVATPQHSHLTTSNTLHHSSTSMPRNMLLSFQAGCEDLIEMTLNFCHQQRLRQKSMAFMSQLLLHSRYVISLFHGLILSASSIRYSIDVKDALFSQFLLIPLFHFCVLFHM